MTTPESSILLVGLYGTGKTNFLVGLDIVLDEQTDPNGLVHSDHAADRAYLQPLREQWLRGEELDHTSRQIAPPPHQLLVLHPASGKRATFHIPDLAGETFAAQFVTRSFPQEFVERIQQASGLILFLHCEQEADHALNTHPAFMDPAPANEGDVAVAPAENHGREWQLEDACRQVKLVDLLQFIAEIRRKRPPISIAVAVSAWERVDKAPKTLEAEMPKEPVRFFSKRWPLIDQYLQGNGEAFAFHVFGVSARGGGMTPAEIARLTHSPIRQTGYLLSMAPTDQVILRGLCVGYWGCSKQRLLPMRDSIKIEQALFGYHAGHNLVATSVPLAPRVRQFLATITDSSGPENSNGFEVAFTGLPVPETDFYALFCTWPAPEMSRPGCVWSHVLLIELADLARIPDLSQLRSLCIRPVSPLRISDYQRPLTFDCARTNMGVAEPLDIKRTIQLVRALYEHPAQGIVVLDQAGEPWEPAIFSVWSQQWPRLRREFAFSAGSLGDRRQAGVPFDLQIAPLSSERLWGRIDLPTLVLNYTSPAPNWLAASPAPWIDSAVEDLKDGAQSVLRQFLFDYGSDTEKPRAAFAKLAVAHGIMACGSNADWGALLRFVGEEFPSQTEGVRLKRTLTALPESFTSVEKLERAWAIASFILGAREAEAYPRVDIDFGNAALNFWTQKRDEVITLLGRLVRRKESPLAASFLGAIANAVDCAALKYISERHDELVPMIISHHPALAFEVDTWHLQGHVQSQIYEALGRLSLKGEDWGKIVGAMLIAATYVSIREAVERAGRFVMQGAFRWLEHPIAQQMLPSQSWREALASPAAELLNRDNNLTPAELAFSAWCIPSEIVHRILFAERDDVQNLAGQPLENLPLPLRVPTAFLLTTLGLGATTDAGTSLIVRSFYPLHDALAAREYSEESWSLLASQLPYLGLWRDWDRCEKLRRAVNIWLTQHLKAGNLLSEVASTPERRKLARRVLDSKAEADDFID